MIEDELKLGDYLRKGLLESGFNVDLSRDGSEWLEMAPTGNYDAIVLDVMMPGVDGFNVLDVAAETGVSHRVDLRLRHLSAPASNRRAGRRAASVAHGAVGT